jgi:hypothetical protein
MGVLPTSEMVRIANALLERGDYSSVLGELATLRNPVMADAGPLFEQALEELGAHVPSRDTAIWVLLRHHIGQIAAGSLSPRDGLRGMVELCDQAHLYAETREYVGDSHGLERLLAFFHGYADVEERPTDVGPWSVRKGRDPDARRGGRGTLEAMA